jgi:DNA mismatch repair ATPase MutS
VVLTGLATKHGSVFLVSSHLIELGEALVGTGAVQCYRFDANEESGRLEFDYVLRPGVSAQRLGVRVLQEEGVFDLLAKNS